MARPDRAASVFFAARGSRACPGPAGNTPPITANGSTDSIVLIAAGFLAYILGSHDPDNRNAMGCVTVLVLMSAAHGAELDLAKIATAFRAPFRNTVIGGTKFWSTTPELVQGRRQCGFFRTHLKFYNGHRGELSGITENSGASCIDHDPAQQCGLHLDVAAPRSPSTIRITKTCAAHGAA